MLRDAAASARKVLPLFLEPEALCHAQSSVLSCEAEGGPLMRPLMGTAREIPWLAMVTDVSGDPSLQEERQTGEAS